MISFCGTAQAEEEDEGVRELAQELALGETVYPQDRLELQLSLVPERVRQDGEDIYPVVGLVELGLTDRLQLAVEVPMVVTNQQSGLGNAEIGASYSIFNDRESGLAFTAGLSLGAPAANTAFGEEGFAIEPYMVGYLGGEHLGANLQVFTEANDVAGDSEFGYGAALALLAGSPLLTGALEVSLEREDETIAQLSPGLYMRPSADLEFGFAAPIGLTQAAPDYAVALFVTWEAELAPDAPDDDDLSKASAQR